MKQPCTVHIKLAQEEIEHLKKARSIIAGIYKGAERLEGDCKFIVTTNLGGTYEFSFVNFAEMAVIFNSIIEATDISWKHEEEV